jgi:hypothetical protein
LINFFKEVEFPENVICQMLKCYSTFWLGMDVELRDGLAEN